MSECAPALAGAHGLRGFENSVLDAFRPGHEGSVRIDDVVTEIGERASLEGSVLQAFTAPRSQREALAVVVEAGIERIVPAVELDGSECNRSGPFSASSPRRSLVARGSSSFWTETPAAAAGKNPKSTA